MVELLQELNSVKTIPEPKAPIHSAIFEEQKSFSAHIWDIINDIQE
jgi:hypothetical protein